MSDDDPRSVAPQGAWAHGPFTGFDPRRVPSPCFVIDAARVRANLDVLAHVREASGAGVLSALKAFSFPALGPLVAGRLTGTCSSGLHEALLAREAYRGGEDGRGGAGEIHVYSPGYAGPDLDELLGFADHVLFNSVGQWLRFRERCLGARERRPHLSFGLRTNPEHSEGTVPIYDACAPGSRLGIPRGELDAALAERPDALDGIDGLHFHTLCEQGLAPLARTLEAFEARFGDLLPRMRWLNVGGGHHVTAEGYDVEGLVRLLTDTAARHDVRMYMEPGEALAIHCGVLVASVLDVGPARTEPDIRAGTRVGTEAGTQVGTHVGTHVGTQVGAHVGTGGAYRQTILDTSATCHMPDTLEMPYRAHVLGSVEDGEHVHRFGGMTCLAGDRIGDYAFPRPLEVGDRVVFDDMAHYTTVKTTTFNGVPLPAIALWDSDDDSLRILRSFGYADFRTRLG